VDAPAAGAVAQMNPRFTLRRIWEAVLPTMSVLVSSTSTAVIRSPPAENPGAEVELKLKPKLVERRMPSVPPVVPSSQ
jgi:hypothetical protein